jgi:hypothetical protein
VLPLPLGEHDLQGGTAGGGGAAGAVDERERLGGGERRRRRREHGVAGERGDGRGDRPAHLSEDPRPGGVAGGLAQVKAAQARRLPGLDQRADHADRFLGEDGQVRDAVSHQLGQHHRVRPPGEHGQVGRASAVIGGAHLGRDPADGAGDPGRLALPHVGGAQPARRGVRRGGDAARPAVHPGHPGGRQQRGDAGADPAGAVHPDERPPAPREHRGAAVAVSVGDRGGGEFGDEAGPHRVGERVVDVRGEVVEQAGRREQAEHPVDRLRRDAVLARGPRHLGGLP